jgi:hypothetical protein
MILSMNAKTKAFDNVQHTFIIKVLKKLRLKVVYKTMYDKPIANIILNRKKT